MQLVVSGIKAECPRCKATEFDRMAAWTPFTVSVTCGTLSPAQFFDPANLTTLAR